MKAYSDAASSADAPTAAAAPQTNAPELMPNAVAYACRRPWVSEERSTSAVSSPGMIVSTAASSANPASACGIVTYSPTSW